MNEFFIVVGGDKAVEFTKTQQKRASDVDESTTTTIIDE
jgi:hypothetical protein